MTQENETVDEIDADPADKNDNLEDTCIRTLPEGCCTV
jgi:hypothetical protein